MAPPVSTPVRAMDGAVAQSDQGPACADPVDEATMHRRLGYLFRGSRADPRAERLLDWVLDYWRERQ